MTITSKDNDKLKLIRKLQDRKHREREGMFVTEGEDLLEAGLAAGAEPALLLSEVGSGLGGDEVERDLLDSASSLGSGSRVIAAWPLPAAEGVPGPVCVYLHGVGDPGNVGAVIRTAHALVDGGVALGPGCADAYSPKAVRASMGSIFAVPPVRCELADTPAPRIALVAHGGERPGPAEQPVTICLGAERDGLPPDVAAACDARWTIGLRAGTAESLNVAAAAAIALERISSAAAGPHDPGQA